MLEEKAMAHAITAEVQKLITDLDKTDSAIVSVGSKRGHMTVGWIVTLIYYKSNFLYDS